MATKDEPYTLLLNYLDTYTIITLLKRRQYQCKYPRAKHKNLYLSFFLRS